jgi:hypothetical protein
VNDNQTSARRDRIEDIEDRLRLFILGCFQVVAISMEELLVGDGIIPAMRTREDMGFCRKNF